MKVKCPKCAGWIMLVREVTWYPHTIECPTCTRSHDIALMEIIVASIKDEQITLYPDDYETTE